MMRRDRHDIVVIGASAGGIEVLLDLVHALPRNLPAAIFIVVHQGEAQGRLSEILGRNGNLPTMRVLDNHRIAPQHIYVAPPNYHLELENDRTRLLFGPKVNRHRPAVDPLFQSAAREYGSRVIGIVLSGNLDDGTAGLIAIKQNGGVAIVQDPADAVFPGMPRSALGRVRADYCVPAVEIGPLLVKLVNGKENKSGSK